MTLKKLATVLVAVLLLSVAVAPAAAHDGAHENGMSTVDECKNADKGPGANGGPPSFVGGLVPDFLGDLMASLPVPNFVKSLFGAETC